MTTIKRLVLKKFRSHVSTIMHLHPGVNVIWGDSMVGKTNIIRGLKLLINNRPRNARYFYRYGSKKGTVVVKAVFDDNNKVALHKHVTTTKAGQRKVTKQEYLVNGDEPLSGFKTTVPPEVSEVLNVSDLNIQYQLEPHFILAASGGKIAQIINDITGLDQVDEWQSTVSSRIRASQALIARLKDKVKLGEVGIKKFRGLNAIGPMITKYNKLCAKFDLIEEKIEDIGGTVQDLRLVRRKIKRQKVKLEELQGYEKQLRKFDEADIKSVISKLKEFVEIENELQQKRKMLETTKSIYAWKIRKEKRCPFCFSKVNNIDQILEGLEP